MRLVVISDTHLVAQDTPLPAGDVLIHCGDFCINGTDSELYHALTWFRDLEFEQKACIMGNHDEWEEKCPGMVKHVLDGHAHYLNGSEVTIHGLKFWGSPIQPEFKNYAFNRTRLFRSHYWKDAMPDDVDVLLTHCPPRGVLDETHDSSRVGCKHLGFRVEKVRPILHAFGHIHESRGCLIKDGIGYVNASMVERGLLPVHKPFVFDLEPTTREIVLVDK